MTKPKVKKTHLNGKFMKQIFFFFTALMISITSLAQRKSSSDVHVQGYYRNNGTYVSPYSRTAPNSTNIDNFSTIGNVNPYTGKNGTIQPDQNFANSSPSYNKPDHGKNSYKNDFTLQQYNNTTIEVFSCSSIYDNPKGTGKQIEQACKGKVTLLSQYNEKYYKVKYENTIGFMEVRWIKLPSANSDNYDTNTFAPKIVEVFTCSAIYDKPDSSIGKIINQACDGKVILISQFNENYYKVKYKSTIGYLEARFIK